MKRLRTLYRLLILVSIVASLLRPANAAETSPLVSFNGRTMGTFYSVKFPRTDAPVDVAKLHREVDALLDRLEGQMSTYRTNSELSHFNAQRDTNWFLVSIEFARCVAEAQRVSQLTAGTFDVTIDPLVRLWGFGPDRHTGSVPSEKSIREARRRVDFRKLAVRTEPPALRKADPQLSIDLSGIAKGFAADAIGEFLEERGLTNFLVGIAGEQRARGRSAAGSPWRVGVERPDTKGTELQCVVELANLALSTSGNYRNYFERDGRRYSHVIDPRTGWPVTNTLASVSVVHASSTTADALAKPLMVMGPEVGFAFAVKENIAALFIVLCDGHFESKPTPAFERLILK